MTSQRNLFPGYTVYCIFLGHNFSQELQILINFLCAIWDFPITSSWQDLQNKSEMKNKEVWPIKRCDLPCSNSLVWWRHKNTSNFKRCVQFQKSFETTSSGIGLLFTNQILYLLRINCQKTLLFFLTTMQKLLKGAKSQFQNCF